MTERSRSRGPRRALRTLPAILILLLAGAVWWFHTYAFADGQMVRRDADVLDRRGEALSPERFEELRSLLPETEILWDVPLSGGAVPSDSVSLTLDSLSPGDLPLFGYFPRLETVDASACGDVPLAMALQESLPRCRVLWQAEIAGETFPRDAEAIELPCGTDEALLLERLAWLPALRSVRFTGGPVETSTQDALRAAFPAVDFVWDTLLLGRVFGPETEAISFAGEPLPADALAAIRDNAFRFPALKTVDLTGCGFENAPLRALDDTLEGVDVLWSTELYGVSVSSADRELDLSDIPVRDDGAALDAVLPFLPRLEKVDMSRCGLSYERLDQLDQRFGDVRIVWTMTFSAFTIRTDDTTFCCAQYVLWEAPLYSFQCDIFRYCPDLIALDLGHRQLTDISFLRYLPKLQYLILAVNQIRDIAPIASLTELKYLELFGNRVEDFSPLLSCTKLRDLNICYNWAPAEDAFGVLTQMPWLERLWYCGSSFSEEQMDALHAAMPGCEMFLEPHAESTGGTWRTHEHYYEMRDVFGMEYMKGGIN